MKEFVLYSDINSKKTFLEIWGSSTKHCDVLYCLQTLINEKQFQLSEFGNIESNMFQFLLYCASRLTFDFNAFCLTQFAIQIYTDYYNNLINSIK